MTAAAVARPRRLVVLLGAKLIGLDTILPVIMAVRAEAPAVEIRFLFLNRYSISTVRENYVLDSAMRKTGKIDFLSSGTGCIAARLAAAWRLAAACTAALRQQTWLFSFTDARQFPIAPMARAARLGGGKVVTYAKSAYPGGPAELAAHRSKPLRQGRDVRFADTGDCFLLYHPDQAPLYADFGLTRPTLIGTPRQYREWIDHLDQIAEQDGLRDASGRQIDIAGRPVVAVFYSGDVVIPTQTDRPREALQRILSATATTAAQALVLIKPHPNCDIAQLDSDIATSERPDAVITFAHPQLLARVARVAVFNNASNAINDAYAEGTPVIETSAYTREILAHGPSLFPNRGRIDGRDEACLRAALADAVDAPDRLPTPDRGGLVRERPVSMVDMIAEATGQR